MNLLNHKTEAHISKIKYNTKLEWSEEIISPNNSKNLSSQLYSLANLCLIED